MKTLTPMVSANTWSYIVNENGNAIRISLEGYGSCTPANVMQEFINNLKPEIFEEIWQECEVKKDVK